jgi:hypothetical protein
MTVPTKKRVRVLISREQERKEKVPDIDDVISVPPQQTQQTRQIPQRKEIPKSAKRNTKRTEEVENQSNVEEPIWSVRRRSNENENEESAYDTPSVDMCDLFKPKTTTKKSEKLPDSQGVAVGDLDMPDVGITYPSFCLEMFTGHSVLPLASCYVLGGPTNSFKSHFAFEIARWVASLNGVVALAENEGKYNQDMPCALMGRELGTQVWVYECTTFNQVQSSLVDGIDRRDKYDTTVPMMQIIDSIVGNATESNLKKLRNTGEIERGYPANALAAANFLPSYIPMLSKKPYMGLWVTHSKDVEEMLGKCKRVSTTLKGGSKWESQCRMAFILRRISDNPKYEDRVWTVRLKLQLKKDASVRGFQLPFNVRCTYDVIHDKEHDEFFNERKLRFCWDEATLNLWLDPEKAGYPPYYKAAIRDITGFAQVKMSGKNVFIAPKIGIGKEDATRDCCVIMDALYSSQQVLDRLRAELGIKKGLGMQRGEAFASLIEKARTIAMRRASMMKAKNNITYIRREDVKEYG